jgi:hypothetical protein
MYWMIRFPPVHMGAHKNVFVPFRSSEINPGPIPCKFLPCEWAAFVFFREVFIIAATMVWQMFHTRRIIQKTTQISHSFLVVLVCQAPAGVSFHGLGSFQLPLAASGTLVPDASGCFRAAHRLLSIVYRLPVNNI